MIIEIDTDKITASELRKISKRLNCLAAKRSAPKLSRAAREEAKNFDLSKIKIFK